MKFLRAGELINVAKVVRPPAGNFGTRGEKLGQAETIYPEFCFSMVAVSGSEDEIGRQNVATATYAITGYTDPNKPIKETDWLVWKDGYSAEPRILEVASAAGQPGLIAELVCGETKDE